MFEHDDEIRLKKDIRNNLLHVIFELALSIPFFYEALNIVEMIFTENSSWIG